MNRRITDMTKTEIIFCAVFVLHVIGSLAGLIYEKIVTREEFDNTRFGVNALIKVIKDERVYDLVSIDFGEALIAVDVFNDPDDPKWYRCESVELV